MTRRASRGARAEPGRPFAVRLLRDAVLWLPLVFVVWWLLTPFYNRFLTVGAERLLRATERPGVTRLLPDPPHRFAVTRTDFPPTRGALARVRITDVHFPVLLLGALFLAVPAVPWRTKLENLAWGLLVAACFHLLDLFLWVKFVYALGLGDWSAEHYGPMARNVWGLAKHLADLPFKLGLPLFLWAVFYLRHLLPARPSTST